MQRHKFLEALVWRYGENTISKHIQMLADDLNMSEGGVKKWIYPSRRPRYPIMLRIEKLTEGRMSVNDW